MSCNLRPLLYCVPKRKADLNEGDMAVIARMREKCHAESTCVMVHGDGRSSWGAWKLETLQDLGSPPQVTGERLSGQYVNSLLYRQNRSAWQQTMGTRSDPDPGPPAEPNNRLSSEDPRETRSKCQYSVLPPGSRGWLVFNSLSRLTVHRWMFKRACCQAQNRLLKRDELGLRKGKLPLDVGNLSDSRCL